MLLILIIKQILKNVYMIIVKNLQKIITVKIINLNVKERIVTLEY